MSEGNGNGQPQENEKVQPPIPGPGADAKKAQNPIQQKAEFEQQQIEKLQAELQKTKNTAEQIEATIRIRQGRLTAFNELLQEQGGPGPEEPKKAPKGRKARKAGVGSR